MIGVQTEPREDSPLDDATRIRAFERGLVDTGRYEALIAERVYPPVHGFGSSSTLARPTPSEVWS